MLFDFLLLIDQVCWTKLLQDTNAWNVQPKVVKMQMRKSRGYHLIMASRYNKFSILLC